MAPEGVVSEAEGPAGRFHLKRGVAVAAASAAVLLAFAAAALAAGSCIRSARDAFRREASERIYEYGASLARDSSLILARKTSSFVIPRDIVRKLVLGLKSTASVQIACQAEIGFAIRMEELAGARRSWSGGSLRLELPPPLPQRPLIETASIRRAILDRGLLVDERAELDALLSELSDLVAGSPDAAPDAAVLEECRRSLEDICAHALAPTGRGVSVSVTWKEP
jgi:hypothetical protein